MALEALEHRLARWIDAGFLSAEQANQIVAFERERGRPMFSYAVAGLGGLAIAIGIVSIVASNWDAIPGRVKLAVDLALVAGLGYAVVRWERDGPRWAYETAIVGLYGLVLTSISLIGQVYQLGGKAHEAMGVWTVLTALVATRGRSTELALVWLVGLQSTYGAWLIWIADGPLHQPELALAGVYWAPLLCLMAGRSRWIERRRPAFARVFESVAWVELIGCASMGTLAFYEHTTFEEWGRLWFGFGVSAAVTAWLWTRLPGSAIGHASRWLLLACLALSHLPILLSPGDLDVGSALTFIALWGLVALTAHRAGWFRLLNAATAVIGLRIIVVYFEVFGSRLGTGVGLVSGGLLTLGLVWLWTRKRRGFERELGNRGQP